jgi:hypothetical protein
MFAIFVYVKAAMVFYSYRAIGKVVATPLGLFKGLVASDEFIVLIIHYATTPRGPAEELKRFYSRLEQFWGYP